MALLLSSTRHRAISDARRHSARVVGSVSTSCPVRFAMRSKSLSTCRTVAPVSSAVAAIKRSATEGGLRCPRSASKACTVKAATRSPESDVRLALAPAEAYETRPDDQLQTVPNTQSPTGQCGDADESTRPPNRSVNRSKSASVTDPIPRLASCLSRRRKLIAQQTKCGGVGSKRATSSGSRSLISTSVMGSSRLSTTYR
jgi:hypothetical protein